MKTQMVQWLEPGPLFATNGAMTGLDFLRGMITGEVVRPPIAQVLGIEVREVDAGRIRMSMSIQDFFVNHLGYVAGGILATALDTSVGCAVLSSVPSDRDMVTLDLNIDFIRAVRGDIGELTMNAQVVHQGANRALASGEVVDASGRVYAIGKSNCLIRPKSPVPA